MATLPPQKAASSLTNIPDIITDILSRLPSKSLLRFRCVSKPWCTEIDSPDFTKLHLQHSLNSETNLSLILRDCHLLSIDLPALNAAVKLNNHPLEDDNYGTDVLGSCNGLVALYNTEEDIALWNPSTKKHQKLPVSELEFPGSGFCVCQFIVYGFGYDSVHDDYKLVRLVQFYGEDDDSFDSEVKVYSLKTNSWKRIKDFPYYLRYKRAYGVLANEALHWVVSRKPESDTRNLIVAFDLCSEEYRIVKQPNFVGNGKGYFHMNVAVLGGNLCVLALYIDCLVDMSNPEYGRNGSRVDVWVMKEYGVKESWTKLLRVAQPEMISYLEFVIPVMYSKDGKKVLLDLDHKRFAWYDLESSKIEIVRILGLPNYFEVALLVESLVPLKNADKINVRKQKVKAKKKQNENRKKRDSFLSEGFKLVL